MKFVNRWKIEGALTTISPLRIGDGETIEAKKRLASTHLKKDTKINTITVDKSNKPYIPASAIKGNLRSWAERNGIFTQNEVEIIFGSRDPTSLTAKAGKVQFSNAIFEFDSTLFCADSLADWSAERLTAVSVGIAVNRKTRTASEKKLFHSEYVPAGVTFKFNLSGSDYEITDEDEAKFSKKIENYSKPERNRALADFEEIRKENNRLNGDAGLGRVLKLLGGFQCNSKPVCIGAETGDSVESWGRLQWSLSSVQQTDANEIGTWFESVDNLSTDLPFKKIDSQKIVSWVSESKETDNFRSDDILEISLSLKCLDDFLVNDPSKTKRDKGEESDRANHSPLRDKDGKPILPKSSIKGAIRSQAERILRTMAISAGCAEENLKTFACYPDDMKLACDPVKTKEEVKDLCLACQLFGASGWKSPISFTDFTVDKSILVEKKIVGEEETPVPKRREFVAIDRFTGGVSGGGKFNAEVAHCPTLKGKMSFDISRLVDISMANEHWSIGLLSLVFRDLIEGDIRFGFGQTKGFGEIKSATVEKHNLNNLFFEHTKDLENLGKFENIDLKSLANSEFGIQLQICVEQLILKIRKAVSGDRK